MPRGGYRPGAGRPRKNPEQAGKSPAPKPAEKNQPPEQLEERIERTPLEYMVDVMNDPKADQTRRDRMALAAAPYVHGKAAEVGSGKKELRQTKAENSASGGKYATPSAPTLVVSNK